MNNNTESLSERYARVCQPLLPMNETLPVAYSIGMLDERNTSRMIIEEFQALRTTIDALATQVQSLTQIINVIAPGVIKHQPRKLNSNGG